MAGLQPDIYAAISITWVAAFLALGLRLKARRMTKMNLWFDDYFAIIALLFVSGYCSVTIYWTHSYKLGQSILAIEDTIEASRIQDRSRLLLWICELLYASSIAFCKLSILCFYWRVFQYTSIRYAIIILLIAVSIWITIRTFMVIFHCVPIRAYWDKSIQGAKCPFNEANFFFATILIHTTMDCVILILPVIEVMKMTLPLSQKLAVVGLFTSGTILVSLCYDPFFVTFFQDSRRRKSQPKRRSVYQTLFYRGTFTINMLSQFVNIIGGIDTLTHVEWGAKEKRMSSILAPTSCSLLIWSSLARTYPVRFLCSLRLCGVAITPGLYGGETGALYSLTADVCIACLDSGIEVCL
ncbi:hypothetical protein FOXB_14253 [Fusarium oxysporum f. sp. conglutinans Fo5176]|uniref:Rhodopsin domain-containing protein n=1 Tax=Fusarium oxysporum (strain Fo5176) TaxID=660025 RepID=F9G6H1_FUSOF|nr:hypothetical protein FOXB_14253 [Fusarium oxysporum f. sp. conglutinans Fo5176]